MRLRALTDGAVSGTGVVTLEGSQTGGNVGAIAITTDGTNQATVILRRDNSSGRRIFDVATVSSMWIIGPIDTEGTQSVYYDVSGTGAAAHIYEWHS